MATSVDNLFAPTPIKRWPWILRWLEPHHAEDRKKFLVRCEPPCGSLMWIPAPSELKRLHVGHRMKVDQNGSLWEFAKMKLGRLDRLTWRERFQLWAEASRDEELGQ